MKCLKCGGALFVAETRKDGNTIKRMRDCKKCNIRYSTAERITKSWYKKTYKIKNEKGAIT